MSIVYIATVALAVAGSGAMDDAARTAFVMDGVVQGQGRGQGQGQGRAEPRGQGGGQGQGQAQPQPRGQGQGQARGQSGGQGQGGAEPRGQGGGQQGQARPRGQSGGAGQGAANSARERRGAPGAARGRVTSRQIQRGIQSLQPGVRRLAASDRPQERMVAGAAARAVVRGLEPGALVVASTNDRVRVMNRENELLLDLDERRARELGSWEVRRLGDRRAGAGSPAFCRSGEGHPVWGREWCIQQRFGLGGGDILWSRGTVDDVIFGRRTDRDRLDRGSLIDVLGDVVFGRLALHALSLGYDEPLIGRWVAEPEGPRLLRVYSGDRPVAELVDTDRDDRVEILYVAQLR